MQRSLLPGWLLAATLLCSTFAYAQGVQTGTVTGIVASADGLPLPGVTVTATSPALQGERSTVSDTNGVYYVRALPAGTYTIDFVISNFQPSTRPEVVVTVGGVTQLREVSIGNNFTSHNPTAQVFGLGTATVADSVQIEWPDGTTDTYNNVSAGNVVFVQ